MAAPPLPPEIAARLDAAIEERFLAATGPGGQNVNKVATAVQLRLNGYALRLDPDSWRRFKALAGSRLTTGGELVIVARGHRTREANREEARERVAALVAEALVEPNRRAPSRLNRVGNQQRLAGKKNRAAIKQGRGRIRIE